VGGKERWCKLHPAVARSLSISWCETAQSQGPIAGLLTNFGWAIIAATDGQPQPVASGMDTLVLRNTSVDQAMAPRLPPSLLFSIATFSRPLSGTKTSHCHTCRILVLRVSLSLNPVPPCDASPAALREEAIRRPSPRELRGKCTPRRLSQSGRADHQSLWSTHMLVATTLPTSSPSSGGGSPMRLCLGRH